MRLLVDFQWHWNSSKNRIKTVVLGKCLGSYGEGIERRPQPESAFDEIGIPIHNPTFHATQTAFQLNSQIPFSPPFFFLFFLFFFPQEKWKRLGNGEIKWKSLRRVDEGWVRKSKVERTPVRLNSIQACLVAPEETTSFSSLALTNPAPPQV